MVGTHVKADARMIVENTLGGGLLLDMLTMGSAKSPRVVLQSRSQPSLDKPVERVRFVRGQP